MQKNKPFIIITGGTRGLGLSTAIYLSKLEWNLIIIDISQKASSVYKESKNIIEVKKKLKNNNIVDFFFCDLSIEKNVKKTFNKIKKKYDRIDGLVTFAGGDIKGTDKTASGGKAKNNNLFIDKKDFDVIFKRNFYTTYYSVKNCIPLMKKNSAGKIVTISSILATFGTEFEFAYSSSKSNIIHLTRAAASHCRNWNINVNCVAPSGVKTGRFMSTMKNRSKHDLSRLKNKKKLLSFAEPEDVAKVVYFLLSDLSAFVSGQVIKIDGGEVLSPA